MNDRDAVFTQFFQCYAPLVQGLARARVRRSQDIDELVSVVWWDVYQAFAKFQIEDPRPMLRQLIRWRAQNLYRREQPEAAIDLEQELLLDRLQDAQPGLHDSVELRMTLEQALKRESPHDRDLIFGRYLEGLTWEELASLHGTHRNTVWKRAQAALSRLRGVIEEAPHRENQ